MNTTLDFSAQSIAAAAALSLSLSLDAFAAAFGYGCSGTRIPFRSGAVINIVCTALLAVSLFAGTAAEQYIPPGAGAIVSFATLFVIGVIKLVQGLREEPSRGVAAKALTPAAAAVLAAGLSIDGVAAGFGAGVGGVNWVIMLAVSLAAHIAAIPAGCVLGRRLAGRSKFSLAWVGGAVIIVLALTKLL